MIKKSLSLLLASLFAGAILPAAGLAGTGTRAAKIGRALTNEECSACHMAYQAGFLPARSWQKITRNLDDHFGKNASLDEPSRKAIETYLKANAADAEGRDPSWLNSIPASVVPMRITRLSWFRGFHDNQTMRKARNNAAIGTISNCAACHREAVQGYFRK